MAAVKSDIPVKINGHNTAFVRCIRTKFETLSTDNSDSKRRSSTVGAPQYTSYTLGRRPSRSGSFSFQRSKDVPDISVAPARQLFLRDHENRTSSRSLDLDYDSATLSTPPRPVRRQKRVGTSPSLIPVPQRTLDTKKLKEKLTRKPSPIFNSTSSFLSPAQSLTNLATAYPVSPGRKSPVKKHVAAPVYNLSIAPSIHNVSATLLCLFESTIDCDREQATTMNALCISINICYSNFL